MDTDAIINIIIPFEIDGILLLFSEIFVEVIFVGDVGFIDDGFAVMEGNVVVSILSNKYMEPLFQNIRSLHSENNVPKYCVFIIY